MLNFAQIIFNMRLNVISVLYTISYIISMNLCLRGFGCQSFLGTVLWFFFGGGGQTILTDITPKKSLIRCDTTSSRFVLVFFCLLYFWGFLLGLCWIWDNLKYLKHYELVISPGFFPHSCKRFTMIVYRHHSMTWNFDPFICNHIYKCNNACEIHFHFFLTEVINTFTKTNVDRKHSVKITPVTIIQYYFYW